MTRTAMEVGRAKANSGTAPCLALFVGTVIRSRKSPALSLAQHFRTIRNPREASRDMSDTRRKNARWTIPDPVTDWDQVNAAVLMDIRDELQELNRTMSCYRVRDMADAMIKMNRRLERNYRLVSKRRKAKS